MTLPRWMRTEGVRAALVVAALVPSGACERPGENDAAPRAGQPGQTCRVVRSAIALPPDVAESSGAAFDPRAEGVFWTHGDSGADPVIFAFGADGQPAARVVVAGARNRDWEDLAIGPCGGGGDCVYLADIGNNLGRQRDAVLYRVPLPALTDSATAPAEEFRARFPGEALDAEALFVTTDGGVFLINKGQHDEIELWRWPTPLEAGPVDLVRIRTLAPEPGHPGDAVTSAGASQDGRWVAVRTYTRLLLYRTADLLGSGQPAFSMDLAPLAEPQGEGVAMRSDGTVLLTSESGGHGLAAQAAWLQCPLP
ncbi:MAG: hypothetical protein KY467_06310 [Gemmatimonadetes bacterium]|nr:hypothetical protein [Gemmatimonadota bacterium]